MTGKKDLLKELLIGEDSDFRMDIKHNYVSGVSNTMALTNMSMVAYLYHKLIFNNHKEATLALINGMVSKINKDVQDQVLASTTNSEELDILKDDIDDIISEVKEVMDKSHEEIKEYINKSFEACCRGIDKISKFGIHEGSENRDDSGEENSNT